MEWEKEGRPGPVRYCWPGPVLGPTLAGLVACKNGLDMGPNWIQKMGVDNGLNGPWAKQMKVR